MDPSYNNNNPQYRPPTQQGSPQTDPYRYDQQQQSQIPNSTQSLDEFDSGWFKCYKVALGFAALLGFFGFLDTFTLLPYGGGFIVVAIIQGLLNLSWIAMVVLQFLAMKNRDLLKAKIALVGFMVYIASNFLILLITFGANSASSNKLVPVIMSGLLTVAFDGSLTLIGSFKVYQILSENQIKSEFQLY